MSQSSCQTADMAEYRLEYCVKTLVKLYKQYSGTDKMIDMEGFMRMVDKEIKDPNIKAKLKSGDCGQMMGGTQSCSPGEKHGPDEFFNFVAKMCKCKYSKMQEGQQCQQAMEQARNTCQQSDMANAGQTEQSSCQSAGMENAGPMEKSIGTFVDTFLDYSHDGMLNKRELKKLLDENIRMPEVREKIDPLANEIMYVADTNQDKEIDFREYMKFVSLMAESLYCKKISTCQ